MKPPASADMPWLISEAAGYLSEILLGYSHEGVILETGAGGSTVFFAERCGQLITYEHTTDWAFRAMSRLTDREINPCDMRLRPDYPKAGLLAAGDTIPPLDLAFIDGRGRVRSVIDVLPFIKPGGWLVLDDSDRVQYAEARRIADLACSLRVVFRSKPDETTFWRIK